MVRLPLERSWAPLLYPDLQVSKEFHSSGKFYWSTWSVWIFVKGWRVYTAVKSPGNYIFSPQAGTPAATSFCTPHKGLPLLKPKNSTEKKTGPTAHSSLDFSLTRRKVALIKNHEVFPSFSRKKGMNTPAYRRSHNNWKGKVWGVSEWVGGGIKLKNK